MRNPATVDPARTESGPEAWVQRLRGLGRITTARVHVLTTLAEAERHLTVNEIHQRLADSTLSLDKSTVYRTVDLLVGFGLVHQVDVHGIATFGLSDRRHHHVVCVTCGRVDELSLDAAEAALHSLSGAGVDLSRQVEMTVSLVCRECRP